MRSKYTTIALVFVVIAPLVGPTYRRLPLEQLGDATWPLYFLTCLVVLPILVMSLMGGGLRQIIDDIGLMRNPIWACLFGLAVTAPAFIGFSLQAPFNPDLTAKEFFLVGLFFPFVEEVFFRGFLFGQLYKRAGWSFWLATFLPAIVFALGHFNQSSDPLEIAGILAITALGALLFCYLFVQWGGNLWAPVAVHAFLNMCWFFFAVDDTALGGFYANGLRLLTVVLTVLFCFFAPRFGWLTPLERGGADGREAPPSSSTFKRSEASTAIRTRNS